MIEMPGINISPTIYLEEYYESYVAGRKIEQIVDDIKQLYEEIKQENRGIVNLFGIMKGSETGLYLK